MAHLSPEWGLGYWKAGGGDGYASGAGRGEMMGIGASSNSPKYTQAANVTMQNASTAFDKSGCEYTGCRRCAKGGTPGAGWGLPPSAGGSVTGGSAEQSGKG